MTPGRLSTRKWHGATGIRTISSTATGLSQLLSGTYESWSSAAAVEALNVIKPMDAELRYAVKDPYNKIEAERYNIGKGFVLEGALEGGLQLGGIQPGHYAAYKNVDFGSAGAKGFIARAASATGGGNIEIRLDALDGPKVGTLHVEGTGGWNNYIDAVTLLKDDQGNPSTITGKHDVYLVFTKTNDPYLFNLNWFKFTAGDPTKTDAYAKLKAGDFESSEGLGKNAEGGYLDGIRNNAFASYKGIDFGSGASGISVHVSSGSQGGTIEVKLDSLSGPTIGTVDIPALGGWDKWVDIMANIDDKAAAGVHDVYLVFHGAGGTDYPCNLDWFTFTTLKGKARDAYAKLEAEDNNGGVGFGTESGGGQTYLAGISAANNPYVMYNYVDFGSASPSKFHVNAASATAWRHDRGPIGQHERPGHRRKQDCGNRAAGKISRCSRPTSRLRLPENISCSCCLKEPTICSTWISSRSETRPYSRRRRRRLNLPKTTFLPETWRTSG